MALTTVGALALAVLFAALSRRLPADGGPYAYARVAFGNAWGFTNAWSYWITAWAGNAAIAVGWVLYVEHFINTGHNPVFSVLLVLVGLWIPAAINLSGVKNMGSVQVVTTIVKFVVLAFMATVGLFFIEAANYVPWNVSGESAFVAIGGGMAIALFSYLGVETAAVAAAKVRDPDRNIPRATILGTLATAVVYMLSLTAVFGILPTSQLASANAPFSDAANAMFGGTWAGDVMAIAVIISGFGALNGWTMICAEMPLAAAKDGLFPERFKRLSRHRGADLRHRDLHRAGLHRRDHQLPRGQRRGRLHHPRAHDRHHRGHPVRASRPSRSSSGAGPTATRMETGRFVRDMTVAVLSLVFSILFIWYSRNTGQPFWLYWAPFLLAAVALLLGVPVYRAQRNKMSNPSPYRRCVENGRSPKLEARYADRGRTGRECAAAAFGPDDHRGTAAQHQDRGAGARAAGRGAQPHRRARQRTAGGPVVPAGRVLPRSRTVPAGRPGRRNPRHDRLPRSSRNCGACYPRTGRS